jgi:hypothetical protein
VIGHANRLEVVDRPHCSTNLSRNDFHLSQLLKKYLADKRFATDADVKQAITY